PRIYSVLVEADRRLMHAERLKNLIRYREQVEVALRGLAGSQPTLSDGQRDEWRQLISHFAIPGNTIVENLEQAFGDGLPSELKLLEEEPPRSEPVGADRKTVQALLGGEYELGEALPREIPGVPRGAVRQYLAIRRRDRDGDEPVLVRAYSTQECS